MILVSTHRHKYTSLAPPECVRQTAVCASITLSKCQTPTRTRLPRRSPSTRCVRVMTIHSLPFPSRACAVSSRLPPKLFFLLFSSLLFSPRYLVTERRRRRRGISIKLFIIVRVTNGSPRACRTPCGPPLPSCPSERSVLTRFSFRASQGKEAVIASRKQEKTCAAPLTPPRRHTSPRHAIHLYTPPSTVVVHFIFSSYFRITKHSVT